MWNEFFPISMPTTAIALCSGIVLRDGKVVVPNVVPARGGPRRPHPDDGGPLLVWAQNPRP